MRAYRAITLILLFFFSSSAAFSQGLIRDAEIENSLKRLAKPILEQAGLSTGSVSIMIVNSPRLNAFVTPGNNLFINLGLIKKLKKPEQLQAVIAHEVAHLTSNHFAKRISDVSAARTAAGIGLLVSLGAAAAGSPDAAFGIAAGSSSAATRNVLANTRAQESSADQISVRYLSRAGIDPKAAIEVLEIFEGQNLLSAKRQDPYAQTHPLSRDRKNALAALATANPPRGAANSANIEYWYGRMVAKVNAFTSSPSFTLRKVKSNDSSEFAHLSRAIANHRKPNKSESIKSLNSLLSLRPQDPYYWELRGQFQLENGDIAGAIPAYKKAVSLAPREPLILAGLGRALNASKSSKDHKEALRVLQKAYAKDPRDVRMLRELATAYARSKQIGQASLITAERYALLGNLKQAATHAKRAQTQLGNGTAGWLKAQDIIQIAERQKR